jgi:hypothetical protein
VTPSSGDQIVQIGEILVDAGYHWAAVRHG